MKAVRYERSGGPEVLELVDVPDPAPSSRDVVVEVDATALNRLDVVQRSGWYFMPGFRFPHIAGMDVAGTVVAIGRDVTMVAVGDRVVVDPSMTEVPAGSLYCGLGDIYGELGIIGATLDGGYAELCLAPETHLHAVPDEMSLTTAATFPTCWLTSWHALVEIGRLQPDESVLIHAAGSGVSVAAIQLAKHVGATVIATAGTDAKCAHALTIGADHVVNNRTGDVVAIARDVTGGRGVDMVLDHVGPALWAASLFALRPRGRLVFCGNTTGDTATIPSLGFAYHMGLQILGSDPYRYREFGEAWSVFCGADFAAVIDSEFPLAAAADAEAKLLSGDVIGKILLRPRS
ncbi:MAG TPA: zinc-binding dehydrogenase [Acidimicrobiales bacterium]|jgi:NADPH:quinone reductase-like Zn-dependent oxidoreductase|nr:zinc-binding dehydrogenase [Acidimicrobiales bacterium]